MSTKSKPTKKELAAAGEAGMDARKMYPELKDCPYPDGPLQKAWMDGWRGQDSFEKGNTMPIGEAEASVALDGDTFVIEEESTGEDQLEDHGHNVTDPEVEESREELAGLMTAFDNVGVQIVEEQWRTLSDDQQTVACQWANNMRIGNEKAVPEFLLPFASDSLKAKSLASITEQRELQVSLMPCEFKKPARSKLDENGEYKVTVNIKVDRENLSLGRAGELLVDARDKVEFGAISVAQWDQTLPGIDNGVTTCEVDILKMGVTKSSYLFGFRVSENVISIEDAMSLWDNEKGSIRITRIGDPKSEKEDQPEPSTAELYAKSSPVPAGQKTLGLTSQKQEGLNRLIGDDGHFSAPDEYLVPSHIPECMTTIYVGQGLNDRFYSSASIVCLDEDGDEIEADWMNPEHKGDGYVTVTAAIQAELGHLIDYGQNESVSEKCIGEWRRELIRLADGGEPIPMPEE